MDVAEVTGHFGRFQMKVLFVMLLRAICAALLLMSYQLISFDVDFLCQFDQYENSTMEVFANQSQCLLSIYDEGNYVEDQQCTSFHFNTTYYSSIVEEWDLVCERTWLITIGYFAFTLGNFFAYVPAGHLADKFGRLPLSLLGQGIMTVCSFALAYSNSMPLFLAIRVVLGVGFAMVQTPLMVIFLESIGPTQRDLMALSFAGSWGVGTMLLAGIAWLVPHWRTLTIITSFPFQLPMLVFTWWLVPESTRWLITVKKYDKAEKQLVRLAKENGVLIGNLPQIMKKLKDRIEQDSRADKTNISELVRNSKLRKITAVIYTSFALTVFIYHGFMITIGSLGDSLRMNYFFSGLIEIPVTVLYFVVVKYFNRRNSLLINFMLSGLLFLLTLPIPEELNWLTITLCMIGRLCNSLAYTLLYVFAAELFPTNLRAAAVSGAMMAGRIGGLAAPFADVLGRVNHGKYYLNGLYGFLSLLTGLIFLLLPQIHNENLPDTVVETERLC